MTKMSVEMEGSADEVVRIIQQLGSAGKPQPQVTMAGLHAYHQNRLKVVIALGAR